MRKKKPDAESFYLLLVGDVMLGRLVNDLLKVKPPVYPWGDTLSLFQQADVRLCNLECAIADRGTPWSATPKIFHFRSDAKNVTVLNAAQIDAVSLANNHVLDFDYEGFFDMMGHLQRAGIRMAGAGATLSEASQPAIWEVRGRKLGLIACTDNEPAWAASRRHPGVWYVPIEMQDKRAHEQFEVVERTRSEVACLVVSLHWGPNWGSVPPPEHRLFAHALIDRGADIVFGHSGHIVRGVEVYKNRPILYCAGNFIDDYLVDEVEHNDRNFLFQVELHETTCSRLLLYPTVIRECQARRASDEERQAMIARMQKLCMHLNTETHWNAEKACLEVDIQEVQ
ncbi:MAG TPA: CapA family protein [Ktedonobacteraceae bacterium]